MTLRIVDRWTGRALPSVLCYFRLLVNGVSFYEATAGLSADDGRIQISAKEIRDMYLRDQALFPMDYKVPLEEVDETREVYVLGSRRFKELRDMVTTNPITSSAVVDQYRRAVNAQLPFEYEVWEVTSGQRVDLRLDPPT